jgi:hypothetical protein
MAALKKEGLRQWSLWRSNYNEELITRLGLGNKIMMVVMGIPQKYTV